MRLLKKISLFSFLFIIVFVLVGSIDINTNAKTMISHSNLITVKGAGIRTSGNEGLRFECNNQLTPLLSTTTILKYGALIAYGSETTSGDSMVPLTRDMIVNAYFATNEANKKINGYSVLNAYTTETDSDGTYYVTIFNIPEDYYLQDITIAPYIYFSSDAYSFGAAVVSRNIGEVALAYLNDGGTTTTLLDNIVTKLTNDYRVSYSDTVGNYYVSSLVYESNPKNIYKQFARDWNKEYPDNEIPTTIDASNFSDVTSVILNITTAKMEDCPLVIFLIKYKAKYGWLLSYLKTYLGSITKPVSYINSGVLPSYDNEDWRTGSFLINGLFGFFAQVDQTSAGLTNFAYHVDLYKNFVSVSLYNHSIYSDLINNEVNIIKTNSDVTLPSISDDKLWNSVEYFDDSTIALENNKYLPSYCLNVKNDNRYYVFTQDTISTTSITTVSVSGINENKTVVSNCTYKGETDLTSGFTGELSISNLASNVTFENIKFNDCELICVDDDLGCTLSNITFKDCVIYVDTDKNFINWDSADGSCCENITFESCTFYSMNTTTSADYANSFISITNNKNLTIDDCDFYNAKNSAININKSTNGLGETGCLLIQDSYFNECLNDTIKIQYIDLANNASLLSYNNEFVYTEEFKNYYYSIVNCTYPNKSDKVIFKNIQSSYSTANSYYAAHTDAGGQIKCTYNSDTQYIINKNCLVSD